MSALTRPAVPRFLFLMRVVRWLLLAVALISFTLTLAGTLLFPAYATAHPDVLAPTIAWTPGTTLSSLDELGWSPAAISLFYVTPFLLNLLAGGSMAIVMLLRKSGQWLGLLAACVFILAAQGGEMFLPLFGKVPGIEGWSEFASGYSWPTLFAFLLVFPDGRFVPRWTRWALLGWVGVSLLAAFVSPGNLLLIGLTVALVAVSLGSQPYRYFRHADAIQRQQTKWVVGAFLLVLAFLPLALLNVFIAPAAEGSGVALLRSTGVRSALLLAGASIPLSMGIAILRYRLWDIDLIIRKTLVYGVLSALLALVYFGSVVALQALFDALIGSQSPVIIVLSTLLMAALFSPLRRQVQHLIDRRFFRQKYDAAQVLARFAQTARDEVSLETLTAELARVVEETMRPERVSVWVNSAAGNRLETPKKRL